MRTIIFTLFTALFAISSSCGQTMLPVQKETFLYSEKDSQKLYMDRYEVRSDDKLKPCVIFMFGGGFVGGTRDEARYLPYFKFLARQGYCVVSIDYRLGFKGYAPKPGEGPADWLNRFVYTIGIAVEDLFDATSFVLENASEWRIDPAMIIANGSSAGAVSVLQGEYYISNGHELATKLPEGFNYAGIISFAGAIFTVGDIRWPKAPCPIQMFHGDADANVPYDKVAEMGMGFYGSKHIAATLDTLGCPYYFYSVLNGSHEMAVIPMDENRGDISEFLGQMVKEKKREQVNTTVKKIGEPDKKRDFTIIDYIKANFGNYAGRQNCYTE